ncbi:hypothetical protein NX059_011138 [Plenodomus lindquistii]|nr:hypothetical protein NX059_011138 [Plenodomus lindquistii]
MQPHVKHMEIFVRTGVWFVQIANNFGQNKEYSQAERDEFRKDPKKLVAHAKDIENQVNGLWDSFYSGSEGQKEAQRLFRQRMSEFIKDKRLLDGFMPKFEVGCRPITPGDPYMKAIQEDNGDVHFGAVDEITETGVIGNDGIERETDIIVCATGFDVTYRPHFPVIGKNGVDLYEKWKVEPEGYLGLAVPDMPNFIILSLEPDFPLSLPVSCRLRYLTDTSHRPVENGSVTGPLLAVAQYTIQLIAKMQKDHIKPLTPRQDVTDAFNTHAQEWIKHTVWKGSCRSWYKDNVTGRVNAVWPGSSNHYSEVIETPRYEDFEIEYQNTNMWAHLGMGYAVRNVHYPEADVSPYLALENMDSKWLKAIGYDGPAGEVEKAREEKEEPAVVREGRDAGVSRNSLA